MNCFFSTKKLGLKKQSHLQLWTSTKKILGSLLNLKKKMVFAISVTEIEWIYAVKKCVRERMKVKWKLDIVAENWKSLPISVNHGQVNPKRFIFRLHHRIQHFHFSKTLSLQGITDDKLIKIFDRNVERISPTNTHSLEQDEGNASGGCKKLRPSKI